VAFMHFGVEQLSRAAAQAAAQRLVQMPPEALIGLSPTEIAEIQNFAVPANGTSTLTPLPALTGSVTGQSLAADNSTPVPARVTFQSSNVLFGRKIDTYTDNNGNFSFISTFNNYGSSTAIPVDNFTLNASANSIYVIAPLVSGKFGFAQTTATQNIVFSNTGVLKGTVRTYTGTPAPGGTVSVQGDTVGTTVSLANDGSGTYQASVLPPGRYFLTAYLRDPNSNSSINVTGTAFVTVAPAQTTTADITLQATGNVSGTVMIGAQGGPAINGRVFISNGSNIYF